MTKSDSERLLYEAAFKYASGETVEEFVKSFQEEYEKAKALIYSKSDHPQRVSY